MLKKKPKAVRFVDARVHMAMICIVSAIFYPFFTPARATIGAALRLSNLKSLALALTVYDYFDLHDFGGLVVNADGSTGPDGNNPNAVTFDSAGNMYGTTFNGGAETRSGSFAPLGLVWEITTSGTYKDLHDFGGTVTNANGQSGPDGYGPRAGITFDSAGNMYGTASQGGQYANLVNRDYAGMVWEITTAGTYKDLHDFGGTVLNANGTSGPDGLDPSAGVTFDSAGNMYGTTTFGGPNEPNGVPNYGGEGMLWEITAAGTYMDLHDFGGTITFANGKSGPDGYAPIGGVTFDRAGNMYGTTSLGQAIIFSAGVVWEITASGTYKDLHDFGGLAVDTSGNTAQDGFILDAGVTLDSDGNVYGTTQFGGPNFVGDGDSAGMVWEITSAGTYKELHDFGGIVVNSYGWKIRDGCYPTAGVTFDGAGNLYGTTPLGGAYGNVYGGSGNAGMVWEITTSGSYKDLHDFGSLVTNALEPSGPDGISPDAGVTFDSVGNIYGTTNYGGAGLGPGGIVWEISTSPPAPPVLTATAGNSQVTLSWTASRTAGTYNVYRGTTSGGESSNPFELGPATSYTDTAAVNGVTYYYQVTAGNLNGVSPDSNEAVATPEAPVAPSPIISPNGGTFTTVQSVTITDSVIGAAIYYTTDGSTPTSGSTLYKTPINVSSSETIKVIAVAGGYANSAVASASFTLNLPPAPTPTISPNGGTITSAQPVSITDTVSGARIYYTIDGSTPSTSSTVYNGPITLSSNETIEAIAVAAGYVNSDVASANFTIAVAKPTISPNGGEFTGAQSVTITDSLRGASIYYSTDGSTPTTGSTSYHGAITVSSNETIKAIAVATGYVNSSVASAAFTITFVAPSPTISPNGGTFTSAQSVTITDSLAGASIYYTTDGSTPMTTSVQYSGPITVSSNETIKAIALVAGYAISAVGSASFTFNLPQPIATFSAGLQMISLPYAYPGVSLDTLFGYTGVKLAIWDSTSNTYAVTPTAPANQIALGQAYWVRFPQAVTVTLAGTSAPTSMPFDIPLQPGWNMVGDPFTASVSVSALILNHGAETFSQATTGSSPLIGATVWAYDSGTNAYASAASLAPDAGYWVFAYSATDVEVSE